METMNRKIKIDNIEAAKRLVGAAVKCPFDIDVVSKGKIYIDAKSILGVISLGFVEEPLDGYLYSQVNAGNAVSLPFNKGFGWGSDVKLRYIFERLFEEAPGGGFPKEWAQAERTNRNILTDVKKVTCRDMKEILKEIDPEFLKGTLEPKGTKEQIYENATDQELVDVIKALVE